MLENVMNNKTNFLLTIILLVLIVINLSIFNNKILTPIMNNNEIQRQYEMSQKQLEQEKAEQATKNTSLTDEEVESAYMTNLKSMGEADRMESYLYNYITLVEGGKYEEAYRKLYSSFKETYFPSIDVFEEYVKKRYPTFIRVEYNDIERQGEYYILTVKISNAIPGGENKSMIQKFVMHELGINEYEMSFQVM